MDRQLIGYAQVVAPDPWHRPITAIQEDQKNNVGKNLCTPIHGLVDAAMYGTATDANPIAEQALEIIFSILEDPSPGLAEVQVRLRQCLAAHPDRPEQALLAHLLETSRRVNANDVNGCLGL